MTRLEAVLHTLGVRHGPEAMPLAQCIDTLRATVRNDLSGPERTLALQLLIWLEELQQHRESGVVQLLATLLQQSNGKLPPTPGGP